MKTLSLTVFCGGSRHWWAPLSAAVGMEQELGSHGAVGSCSCRAPLTQCLGSTCSCSGAGACAFPKGHIVHHSPWLRQRALWEQEEQKSRGSSLSTVALWRFVTWQGHCRQGSGGWWCQVPQSSPSWASVHVHWFKNKLQ